MKKHILPSNGEIISGDFQTSLIGVLQRVVHDLLANTDFPASVTLFIHALMFLALKHCRMSVGWGLQ